MKGGQVDRQFIKKIRTQIAKAAENYSDELLVGTKISHSEPRKSTAARSSRSSPYRLQIRSGCSGWIFPIVSAFFWQNDRMQPICFEEIETISRTYIITHNNAHRCKQVNKVLDKLEDIHEKGADGTKMHAALQRLAEELTVKRSIHTGEDPNALMVFEYAMELTLKEHQVQGIRDMVIKVQEMRPSLRSILLQRIQGGGKSLVFGHIIFLPPAQWSQSFRSRASHTTVPNSCLVLWCGWHVNGKMITIGL